MEADLPYKSEYAKSGRAGCKGCKMPIAKDSLRIARMVQVGFLFAVLSSKSECKNDYYSIIST